MANALSIPEMTESGAEKYATFNLALKYLTAIMTGARDRVSSLPTAIENACWIVSAGFSTYSTNDLLFYFGGAFYSMTPIEGLRLWVWDENVAYFFNGTTWDNEPQWPVASASVSPSASLSPSRSASASVSPSGSASASVSPSVSASASVSPSSSASPST